MRSLLVTDCRLQQGPQGQRTQGQVRNLRERGGPAGACCPTGPHLSFLRGTAAYGMTGPGQTDLFVFSLMRSHKFVVWMKYSDLKTLGLSPALKAPGMTQEESSPLGAELLRGAARGVEMESRVMIPGPL